MNDGDALYLAREAFKGNWAYVTNTLKREDVTPHEIWALKNTFEQLANACEGEYRERVLPE